MKQFIFIFGVIVLSSCWGCRDTSFVKPAFYHWKSTFEIGETELGALDQLDAKRLYLRFFDVDIDRGNGIAKPIARLDIQTSIPQNLELVPCIFITNRTFKSISEKDGSKLVDQVYSLIMETVDRYSLPAPKEIQVDCDWTPSTREQYFSFLKTLRNTLKPNGCTLSATIRLHQYKYPEQTGVPDVDRGMLMVYNVGNLDDPTEQNSIFDLEVVSPYMNAPAPYPLDLDVALPIFGWGVLIRRGKPIRLINNLLLSHTIENGLLSVVEGNRVEVLQSHYFRGQYLYAGDVIRLEAVSSPDLLEGAKMVASYLPSLPDRNIALYHLDSFTLEHYALDTLQAVFRSFD